MLIDSYSKFIPIFDPKPVTGEWVPQVGGIVYCPDRDAFNSITGLLEQQFGVVGDWEFTSMWFCDDFKDSPSIIEFSNMNCYAVITMKSVEQYKQQLEASDKFIECLASKPSSPPEIVNMSWTDDQRVQVELTDGKLITVDTKDKETILFREHRGGLAESMETVVTLPATKEALLAHVKEIWKDWYKIMDVEWRQGEFDARTGWDTWLVVAIAPNQAPPFFVGYMNGPIKE